MICITHIMSLLSFYRNYLRNIDLNKSFKFDNSVGKLTVSMPLAVVLSGCVFGKWDLTSIALYTIFPLY